MVSEYLDFVEHENGDYSVYTKKTKKRLLVGEIIRVKNVIGENKFFPQECIYFGKHCLHDLSKFLQELDNEFITEDK